MPTVVCPLCKGKGKVPIDFSGPMAYSNPMTGESFPHKQCPICHGKRVIKD